MIEITERFVETKKFENSNNDSCRIFLKYRNAQINSIYKPRKSGITLIL